MKNHLKLGLLATVLSLSLASCDFFSRTPKAQAVDSIKIDANKIDSSKIDSAKVDSAKIKADSAKLSR